MATVKILKTDELKKMSGKDLAKLLKDTERQLCHVSLHLRSNESKKSDEKQKLQRQVARIKTFQAQSLNTPTDAK